ncbi:MAG: arginase [Bacteroidetes bacterium]|nr:MAG: arginase [Bacteroidota bacterium]
MDSSLFLKPSPLNAENYAEGTLGNKVLFAPDAEDSEIVIVGVAEDRNSDNLGCAEAPDAVRKYLYRLSAPVKNLKIVDIGNIIAGETPQDTYVAVEQVLEELLKKDKTVLLLGGSNDLMFPAYKAYQNLERTINMTSVDNQFDIGQPEEELHNKSYFTHIILNQPNFLFNYSVLAYQTHFVKQEEIKLMNQLFFDTLRLGTIYQNILQAEPYIRNSDIVGVDISSVRLSDAPGNKNATPNGLYGEQLCQIARFAGISDKVSLFGLFEINPQLDNSHEQTAHLGAQTFWYFIEGYYKRQKDFPLTPKKNYLKYIVNISEDYEIVFYKSPSSMKWWMEVPYPVNLKTKYERHHMVPCTYEDYQTASQGEVPERWWKSYKKLL